MSAAEIARKAQVPVDYLAKILQSLQRKGILSSKRGLNGGYSLILSPQELSLLDVVNTVDPLKRITRCPLGIPEHSVHLCELHKRIDAALEHMETTFRESTISMMFDDGSGSPAPGAGFPVSSSGGQPD
jgi:Rrf2 family protein